MYRGKRIAWFNHHCRSNGARGWSKIRAVAGCNPWFMAREI